ncbi:hypothetical protein AABC73_13610 [Pseudomonas sp. G.S.17]|uniref:hypothetical protein n=1 Tax=Pseudomonas sp. G.S.17 TaxID=3137451 RepID=UPI00311CB28B
MKDEIHRSAKQALKGGVMDAEVYDGDMIEAFASWSKPSVERILDISIGKLIALSPQTKFYPPGSSWRDAAQGLHCDGWDKSRDKIVSYFTSDLLDTSFPAMGSSSELRIGFVGGAVYCRLGNHRAAAAKAWLAGNHGESAVFKKARSYYCDIVPKLKELMQMCVEKGYGLKYSHAPDNHFKLPIQFSYNLVMVERGASNFDLYDLNSLYDSLEPIETGSLFSRLLKLDTRSKCARRQFQEVPIGLIKIMLDDSEAIELFGVEK